MVTLLVRVHDAEAGRLEQLAFIRSPVRIGRGELNDLPLPRKFVSTYHGLVQFDENRVSYVDLGSTNGSVLDGLALQSNAFTPLEPGSELVIGTFRLTFELRQGVEEPAAPRPMTLFASRSSRAMPPTPPPGEAPGAARPPPLAAMAAEDSARQALDAAATDLDLYFASYRGAWEHMRSALEGAIASLEPPARSIALARMAERYPQLRAEVQFAELLGPDAAPATEGGGGEAVAGGEPAALRLLRVFAESYLPSTPSLAAAAEIEAVLTRLADVLETFGRSFLELQRGYEEFGKEMGVRTVQARGTLQRAKDVRQLLGLLLDPRSQDRGAELQRAFGDFMLHQVALLRGVQEGARELLSHLSPEAVAATASGKWPMRAAAQWKAFEERYRELCEDDRAVSDLLFGPAFVRAYASLAGEQAPAEAAPEAAGEEEGQA